MYDTERFHQIIVTGKNMFGMILFMFLNSCSKTGKKNHKDLLNVRII